MFRSYIPTRRIPLCPPRKSDAFVLILGGSCHYRFSDGYRFTVNRGDVLYLAKDALYTMDVEGRYDFICVNFDFAHEGLRQSDRFTPKDPHDTEALFSRLLRKHAGSEGSLVGTLSLLYRIYESLILSRAVTYRSNDARRRIAEARETILASFRAPALSVADLAAKAGMSEAYFRLQFREVYGVSPAKFITDCRLSHSKELLEQDYLTLDEIAEQCGFSTASYLCRVFKKNLGITTTEYKLQLRP